MGSCTAPTDQQLKDLMAPRSGGSMRSGIVLMGQQLSGLMATESGTSMGNILDQMTGAFGLDGSF